MDKILVTGGTGFVGHWIKQTCPEQFRPGLFLLSRLDYEGQLYSNWKYIIHLAPIAPTRILTIAHKCDARVLFASSGIIYHPENDTEYRQNKIKWEQECFDSGVDVVIARLFTFFGKRLDRYKAYRTFTNAAMTGEPLRLTGGGNTVRSYMHGADMGRWMWAVLLNGRNGEAYDVGSDTPTTMRELAQRIIDRHNSSSEIIIEDTPDPMPLYLPEDTEKTKRLLTVSKI